MVYVDPQLSESSCTTYAPPTRTCQGGEAVAYRDLRDVSLIVGPGDTVLIRGGTIRSQFAPTASGAPGAPITFKAYPEEQVVLTEIDRPALYLRGSAYLIVEGLTVTNVVGWGRLEDASHNVIRNNRFSMATARGTTGGLKLVRSSFNKVLGNAFEEGNDSVVIQESDRNLVAGNRFRWGRHSLLSIRCGNFNIVRGNWFHNERQKAAEVYDCEGVSDAPVRLDATKRNLLEGNAFLYTRGPSEPHKYNAIQYAGQFGIVRKNIFYDNRGGAVRFALYAREALNNYGHRVYHNTFYANMCYAVSSSAGGAGLFGDNLVENNLFYRNTDCIGAPVQTGVLNGSAVVLRANAVLTGSDDPRFVSIEHLDLRLRPDSPVIDRGIFLARTVEAGSGTEMRVNDVKYFADSYGIPGETGDLIQLANGTERVQVAGIDYENRILKLDRPIAWNAGQGVTLAFEGSAPDLGAYEIARSNPR
jgi:hypothetical protein